MSESLRAIVSGLGRRGPALGLYALAVLSVPLWAGSPKRSPDPEPVEPVASQDSVERESPERLRVLSGVWRRYEPGGEGERIRFYYFHGDGKGLYRYGRVGLTNTHSFDYDIEGDRLVLDFRKSGEHHRVRFSLGAEGEPGAQRRWLELHDDPREAGSARYIRESDPLTLTTAPEASTGPAPAGHMWMDFGEYATGGRGFAFYQLRAAGIDGRGVGWFHRGDFDDWSTEALTYRIVGDRIELNFSLAGGREHSTFTVQTDDEGARWLELHDDPRDFWHRHRYLDMGPSFGAAMAPWWLRP